MCSQRWFNKTEKHGRFSRIIRNEGPWWKYPWALIAHLTNLEWIFKRKKKSSLLYVNARPGWNLSHQQMCWRCGDRQPSAVLFYFNEQCFPHSRVMWLFLLCSCGCVSLPKLWRLRCHSPLFAWLSHRPPLMEKLITAGVISGDTGVNLIMLTKWWDHLMLALFVIMLWWRGLKCI